MLPAIIRGQAMASRCCIPVNKLLVWSSKGKSTTHSWKYSRVVTTWPDDLEQASCLFNNRRLGICAVSLKGLIHEKKSVLSS